MIAIDITLYNVTVISIMTQDHYHTSFLPSMSVTQKAFQVINSLVKEKVSS